MVEFGYTRPDVYRESFTPERISEFRSRCRAAVDTLLASGESPADVVVEGVHVDLRGWVLHSFVSVQGWEGDEWFRWTRSAVLGEDGELYDVQTIEDQLRGMPYDEDGSSSVNPISDSEMDRWDRTDPENYVKTDPTGYWAPFPGRLAEALDALLLKSAGNARGEQEMRSRLKTSPTPGAERTGHAHAATQPGASAERPRQTDDSQPVPSAKRLWRRLALGVSVLAFSLSIVLCYVLVANALGWSLGFWKRLQPTRLDDVVIGLWLVLSIAGVVLCVVGRRRLRQRRGRWTLAFVLSVAALLAVPICAATSAAGVAPGSPQPSDRALISVFRQHKPQFTRAVIMFRTRGRVDQSLLDQLGVGEGIERDGAGIIRLNVAKYGLAVFGAIKGYAYSKRRLHPTAKNLDHYRETAPSGVTFRHIQGPWYLFYDDSR